MPTQKVKLTKREEIADRTMAFYLEKPAGFDFKAGQFIEVTLINPAETDAEGSTRAFTVASAPYESNIMIATRMRNTAFKRVLRELPPETAVSLEGPFGLLTLHPDTSRPAVFLAGGIGITPFRSILFQASRERLPHRLLLFYSNRRPQDAAFLSELRELEKQNPNFSLVATMTHMYESGESWEGPRGYINREMLATYANDLSSPIYYIAGPPGMVKAMQHMLRDAGVEQKNVRAEEFAGY